MAIEEKIDELTKEIVALRKSIEANGTGVASSEDAEETAPAKKAPAKKAPAKKAPAKKAPAKPKHDADEVASVMRRAAKEVDKEAVQEYISEQGCDNLADLLTKPELFDAAHEFASDMLPSEDEDEDDEGDI